MSAFKIDVKGNLYQVGKCSKDQLGTFAIVRKSSDKGRTWNTIYEQKCTPPNVFAINQAGILYVAGMDYNNTRAVDPFSPSYNATSWLIQKSIDDGKTWSTIDTPDYKEVTALEVAPNGEVYAGGRAKNGSIVRKSSDNGKTWHTVDQFNVDSRNRAYVNRIVFDSRGNIYYVASTEGQQGWVVRMSSDRGASWTTIDKYSCPVPGNIEPTFAVADSAGNIYISGTCEGNYNTETCSSKTYWIVRKGSKEVSWKTVDLFSVDSASDDMKCKPNTIVIDKNGTILVSGIKTSMSGRIDHAVVRMSTDGGSHWTIRDDIPEPDPNYFLNNRYRAFRLCIDTEGNLYAILVKCSPFDNVYWLTQKYFPPEQNTHNFHS